ncbi:hypothetical protein BRYFOR_05175 [Marvinbryantia formatexigens DSM 14469]|uniref:Uncharacterized protein n=1 Tax=Marvinbryantia formatexigens DSM 14469 TaxID=478749 RepID=C6L985_9FIRM|nr:hypothetical protein BRYFOR_05175 [Marvinbryantia formatexigens DSM 14469]
MQKEKRCDSLVCRRKLCRKKSDPGERLWEKILQEEHGDGIL